MTLTPQRKVQPRICNVSQLSLQVQAYLAVLDWHANEPDEQDYLAWTKRGVAALMIDTGRYDEFDETYFYEQAVMYDDDDDQETPQVEDPSGETITYYPVELYSDQRRYVVIMSILEGLKTLQSINAGFGIDYVTPKLSVKNGSKPFDNITALKHELQQERRIVHNRMCRYIYS